MLQRKRTDASSAASPKERPLTQELGELMDKYEEKPLIREIAAHVMTNLNYIYFNLGMRCGDRIKTAPEPMRELNNCVDTQIMPKIMNFFKGPIEETVKDILIEKTYDQVFASVISSVKTQQHTITVRVCVMQSFFSVELPSNPQIIT